MGVGGSPDLQLSFPRDSRSLGGVEANSSVLSKEVDSALGHSWVTVALMKGCLDWPWHGVLRLNAVGGHFWGSEDMALFPERNISLQAWGCGDVVPVNFQADGEWGGTGLVFCCYSG